MVVQSKPLTIKDFLLLVVLKHAGHKTSIRSFQELENDPEALKVYRSKQTIRRQIYRFWSRDPNGKAITPDNSCLGKMTSNKIPHWGATLWHFYRTYRIPSVPSQVMESTASELLNWMIKQGEIPDLHAMNEIALAMNEENPHEIHPFPISEVIETQEMNIRLGIYGISKSIDQNHGYDEDIFCPESYPAPWPLLPFSYSAAKLEHRIPLYQLPQTLVVHDPWDLLSVSKSIGEYLNQTYDWSSSEDRTYLYNRCSSKKGRDYKTEEAKAKKEKRTRRRLEILAGLDIDDPDILTDGLDVMLLVPSSIKSGPTAPLILVLHEAAPDPEPAKIAHIYLSPAALVGEGNHSLVTKAEWEIPRSLIVPDILCYECILEDVHQTLLDLDGADGSKTDEKWKAKSGLWVKEQIGHPKEVVTGVLDTTQHNQKFAELPVYELHPGNVEIVNKYAGPVRPIKTKVKWQNGENYCSHILKRLHVDEGTRAHPLTAKVSVVAKLSKEGDDHLANEAINYENFPQHFFEHWNGYNIIAPLRNQTPVGALIPQYYGYYLPHEDASDEQYLSPIMLEEECGHHVEIDSLNIDDRNECASLFFRLHNEGYLHESVYPRNVLYQSGPLDRPMYQRGTGDFTEDGRKHTFRLIDFGRTRKYQDHTERWPEEWFVRKMTKHSSSYYDSDY